MFDETAQGRLREASVTPCLEALDWEKLKAHLDNITLDQSTGTKLVDLIMRTRTMVFRYPGKLKQRNALLDCVVEKIRADLGTESADNARSRFDLFALIDEVYAALRMRIDSLPLAAMPKEVSFSAYLGFVARDWSQLQDQILKAVPGPRISTTVILTSPEGDRYGADGATVVLVNLMSMNVMLSAYGGKWFDADGIVRIPDIVTITEAQVDQAGAANLTALAWQQWQLLEERCRFLDGNLRKEPAPSGEFPKGAEFIVHDSNTLDWETIDLAANERLGDRLRQTFDEMVLTTNLLNTGQGITPGAPMPSAGYISAAEAHTVVMMSEYLGLDVATYAADLGGLKLIEWVRGFAVLQQLVSDRLDAETDPIERAFPKLKIAELEEILNRNGIAGAKARTFIDHASFAKSSRDLYDAPILRSNADWCLIAAPSLVGALIFHLVLSTLANKDLVIRGKGEAFETQFREDLKRQGLSVYHFEANRPDGPYEFDAVVPWGDYLFVFECKNRSLSGSNPIASYNLLRSTAAHGEQIQRLVGALRKYPNILTEFITEDCTKLILVPVVMSAMPFSLKGDIDGIYFADAAATGRFFQERYMHISRAYQLGDTKVLHRVPIHSQWTAEVPSADDFMRHLEDPLPLRIMTAHISLKALNFRIGPTLYMATRAPHRDEMTIDSMAALGGMTGMQVEAEMDRFLAGAIEPMRARLKAKTSDQSD